MSELRTNYQSYLLRLWRHGEHGSWLIRLEAVGKPDQHYHFATLDELFLFLLTCVSRAPATEERRTAL